MLITVQGKQIALELQLGAIAHICKVFGIDTTTGCSLEIMKGRFRGKDNCKRLPFVSGKGISSVVISNLPLSFNEFHVVTLINLFSDFDTSNANFYVDMYQDAQNRSTGKCLIRFVNEKYVRGMFMDMQGLRSLDRNIIVSLDIDNKLSAEKDSNNPLNYWKRRKQRLKNYILQQRTDYTISSIDGKINKPALLTSNIQCTQNGQSTSVDALNLEILRTVKVQEKIIQVKTMLGAIAHICKEFGIEMKEGSSLSDMKEMFRQKVAGFTGLRTDSPPDWAWASTNAIYIKNLPPSFTNFHVVTLIHLLSDFDVKHGNFYIDMYKNAQNDYTGDCLIRFVSRKFIAQVFFDMSSLPALNSNIAVSLDIGCELSMVKDLANPFYKPGKKINKMIRQFVVQQNFDFSNCNLVQSQNARVKLEETTNNNDVVQQEQEDDVIEVPKKFDVIEILDSEDEVVDTTVKDIVEAKIDKDDDTLVKTSDDLNKKSNSIDDLTETGYISDELVATSYTSDDPDETCDNTDDIVDAYFNNVDTEYDEKSKSESINKASIQDLISVPETEQLDVDTHNNGSIKDDKVNDTTDVQSNEDNTGEIANSDAYGNSESGVMFYEDKTGNTEEASSNCSVGFYEDKTSDTNTNKTKKAAAEPKIQYKVTVNALDNRDIVSVTPCCNVKHKTKINCIVILVKHIDKFMQYDLHAVKNCKQLTGEFLLKFQTNEDARKVFDGLKKMKMLGVKIKKNNFKIKLLSSQDVPFPDDFDNRSFPKKKQKIFEHNRNTVSKAKKKNAGVLATGSRPAKRKMVSNENARAEKRRRADALPTGDTDDDLTLIPPDECGSKNLYGLNPGFLKKLKINTPLNTTVVVKNLHSTVNENKLREVFSLAGVITKVDKICSDAERRTSKVEYEHPVEAVQAISLFHNQELYGKIMTVQMDTVCEKRPLPAGLRSIGQGLGKNGEPLKSVRNITSIIEAKEALIAAGKLTKVCATDHTMPFKYLYMERNQPEKEDNINNSANELNIPNNNANSTNNMDSEEQNPNGSDILDGTSVQELSNALTSQGVIPEGTNCTNLDSLVNVLKSNPPEQQTNPNDVPNENIYQNNVRRPLLPNPGHMSSLNFVRNMPHPMNRPPMYPNLPPVLFHNKMRWPDPNFFGPIMPNMSLRAPHSFQSPMFRPRVDNAMQRAALLYEAGPQSQWNGDSNQQFQNTRRRKLSKLHQQRYFGGNIPEDSDPGFRNNQSSDAYSNEQNEDVIFLESGEDHERIQNDSSIEQSGDGEKETGMLIFKNLPRCVSSAALASKLDEVGEMLFCKLTGVGRAVVRFRDPADADRCISLFHGSKVEGQVITVFPVNTT